MSKGGALSVERAWNTVALEERIELISRANAEGFFAGASFLFFMGSVAYGFDEISLLTVAAVGALIVAPMFSSYCWRRGKPELILKYLAARSVCRRYAYGGGIADFDIITIFRGTAREIYASEEERAERQMNSDVDFDSGSPEAEKDVWVCLMAGGIVVLSEKRGGAKLEFCSPIAEELGCERASERDGAPTDRALVLTGTGFSRGKRLLLWSNAVGALYVFEKKIGELIDDGIKTRKKLLEQLAQKNSR